MTHFLAAAAFGLVGSSLARSLQLYGYRHSNRKESNAGKSFGAWMGTSIVYGAVGSLIGAKPLLWCSGILIGRLVSHAIGLFDPNKEKASSMTSLQRGFSIYLPQLLVILPTMLTFYNYQNTTLLALIFNPFTTLWALPAFSFLAGFVPTYVAFMAGENSKNDLMLPFTMLIALLPASLVGMVTGGLGMLVGLILYASAVYSN